MGAAAIQFSIIIPAPNLENIDAALAGLAEQELGCQIIVATRQESAALPAQVNQTVCRPQANRGELLNAAAQIAQGDLLLFLWPGSQLPPAALTNIQRNFQLLPQTIGGSFHVKFVDDSWLTRQFNRQLKDWRYRGYYYGPSAIFVRRPVFEELGGFKPYEILEDLDFARRMEAYGPTLYLPDKVLASAHKFKDQKLKAALTWALILGLFRLGVHPNKLAPLWFG